MFSLTAAKINLKVSPNISFFYLCIYDTKIKKCSTMNVVVFAAVLQEAIAFIAIQKRCLNPLLLLAYF